MTCDVLCLRPEADFLSLGVVPPKALSIAYRGPGDADVPELMRAAHALVIPAVGAPLPPELFEGTRLKLVQVTGAGLDRLPRQTLTEKGIPLANVPGGSNAALAEYVVANSLSLRRGFSSSTAALLGGNYAAHRAAMVKANLQGLGGLTVGLVGLGTIGLAVAERCHQMGARIAFHDPAPPRESEALARLSARQMGLDELIAEADVLTLHVPLIEATRNLVDARRLALMKPDAVLINAARGGIVDEAALAAALEAGRLGGAAVDVYSIEPPPPDNPLLTVSSTAAARLILTPHIAGVSRQASQFLFSQAWENVARVLLDGAAPRNLAP